MPFSEIAQLQLAAIRRRKRLALAFSLRSGLTFLGGAGVRSFVHSSVLALSALLPAFLLIGCEKKTEGPTPMDLDGFKRHLDTRIPELMDSYDVPGVVVAVIRSGEIEFSAAYGVASYRTGAKMTLDTPCRVESISKSVTAHGIMKLVQQGLIDLDAPVAKYLKSWDFPESRFDSSTITIRQLLSHTSGLPLGTIGVRYEPDGDRPTLKEALSHDAHLWASPGSEFFYSNTGFNLLELVIQEVTGEPFADYMQREILIPSNMNQSSFEYDPAWRPGVPDGHNYDGDAFPPYVYPEKASGGLFATVEDVARFVSASRYGAPGPLNDQSRETMYSAQVQISGIYGLVFPHYGLGHFLEELQGAAGNHRAISHGGQGSGWMTHFHGIPETGDGIVLLTNSQRSWPLFSAILTDWARWEGYDSIGMGLISRSAPYLSAMVWMIVLAGLLFLMLAFRNIASADPGHHRNLAGFLSKSQVRKVLGSADSAQAGVFSFSVGAVSTFILAGLLVAALLYVQTLPYFFLTSIFPVLTPRLGYALLFLAVSLLAYGITSGIALLRSR
ncbi:MAG: serine hydrolase [Spirochaetaceae bacterium]|nr:serine hydrolase [Spirochaetaceae bacterium]